MSEGNRIARDHKRGDAMRACLYPETRVRRTKNFLNEHVSLLRKLEKDNTDRKIREQQMDVKIASMRKNLFDQTKSRYKSTVSRSFSQETKENEVVRHHSSFGKVPEYILRRASLELVTAELEKERVEKAEIPEGYRYMSLEEISSSISELELKRSIELDKLKRLPLLIETLSQRKTKLSIELILMDIDKSIEKLKSGDKILTLL